MPCKMIVHARFAAVIDHAYGQTRTSLLTPKLALKVARIWIGRGDVDVRIETADGAASWTLKEFALSI